MLTMTRRLDNLTHKETFQVTDGDGQSLLGPHDAAWLDWDQRNRLVLCSEGKLFAAHEQDSLSFQLRELADFNVQKPQSIVAPEWATHW